MKFIIIAICAMVVGVVIWRLIPFIAMIGLFIYLMNKYWTISSKEERN